MVTTRYLSKCTNITVFKTLQIFYLEITLNTNHLKIFTGADDIN